MNGILCLTRPSANIERIKSGILFTVQTGGMVVMETDFNSIADTKALEDLLARSQDGPVLLFKHSNACPVSAAAYQEMKRLKRDVAIVVVQRSRDVSREVEARTGVRHETPQALVLRDGKAVWTASHWNITADAVESALSENK